VHDFETSSCNAAVTLLNSINSDEVVTRPVVLEERKIKKSKLDSNVVSDDVLNRPDELVSEVLMLDWKLELSSESDSAILSRT
jgi:hypothetical protein